MTEKDSSSMIEPEAGPGAQYTWDDLQREFGLEPAAAASDAAHPQAEAAVGDDVLSEQEIETYRGLLDLYGPNPRISAILEDDRRRMGDWKRRCAARRCAAPVVVSAPPQIVAAPEAPGPEVLLPIGEEPAKAEPLRAAHAAMVPSVATADVAMSIPDEAEVERAVAIVVERDSLTLRGHLEKLVGSLHPNAVTRKTHAEVRRWIWAINAVMTDRDEIAPCVRAQPKLGRFVEKGADFTEAETLMLNDRQIFDLAYLHKHGWGKPEKKWESLLRSEVFDPILAARFVKTVGRTEAKVKALGLRDEEMMLLAAIRTDAIRKRWERLNDHVRRLEDVLRGVAGMGSSKVPTERVPQWCEEYVGLVIAKGSPAMAFRLLARLYGRTRPAKQLAGRKGDLAKKGFKVG